jgi:hypothetical protein
MKGFILFTTLLFLNVFSLLNLYVMMGVKLKLKESDALFQQQIAVGNAQRILQQIGNDLINHANLCAIPITASILLRKYQNKWWKQHGCHGNVLTNRYYYVIELLAKDVCTNIRKSYLDALVKVDYYRISLLFLPSSIKEAKIILQNIVVTANHEMFNCSH